MAFFPFGRKLEASKGYSFQEIPLFSSLSSSDLRVIEKKMRLVEYKRGDLVYEEGTPADAFYVIVSGRFRVFQKARGEEPKTLAYLYRGDYFGESSLLTGQSHSATVEARSDGLLLRLDKEDFLKTLAEIPALSLHLSRTLGHRLTKIEGPGRKKQEVKVAALYSTISTELSFQLLNDLATNVFRETKSRVLFVDFLDPSEAGLSEEIQPMLRFRLLLSKVDPSRESEVKPALVDCASGFQYLSVETGEGGESEKKISTLLTFLTYRYDFILIRIGRDLNDPSFWALKQSDIIYLLLDPSPERLTGALPVIRELQQTFAFTKNEIKILLPEEDSGNALSYEEKEKILNSKIFHVLPSRSKQPNRYHAAMRFVAKELAGTLLGLALGSGAAYGLAHIGVLRVLEKENIPIDVVAGSSMGALIGALWAAGYKANDQEEIARSLDQKSAFFKLIGFRDLSIAHHGFFHGRQVTRFMAGLFSDKTFQDLEIPVKVIATNLSTSQEVVFDTGKVVDALRASISIPGIFRPCRYRDQFLIDGGILNPLPVDVLTKMGVKKIIAVNVLVGPEDRAQKNRFLAEKRRKLLEERSKNFLWRQFIGPALRKVERHFSDNIFNVIMNTIQFMEYEIAQVASQEADVLIHPIVPQAHWAEFYQPEKFIRAGEEKTFEQIDEIKRLVAE